MRLRSYVHYFARLAVITRLGAASVPAMDEDRSQMHITSDKVDLHSHRLPESNSELLSDFVYSQLSSISSQPSLAELSRPSSSLQQAQEAGAQSTESLLDASNIGPGSFSSGSISLQDIPMVDNEEAEENDPEAALSAESVLLGPWDEPFQPSLSEDRSITKD